MARYVLLVRAPELGVDVGSSFGGDWPLTWREVCDAWEDALRSPGARHRIYTVVEARDRLLEDLRETYHANDKVSDAWAQAAPVPWAASHVQESEMLRSPR
jgi:hypothetical protein